jgi:hypothetical protein
MGNPCICPNKGKENKTSQSIFGNRAMESDEILFIVNFEPHIGNKAALTFFGISMPETMKLAYKIDAFHHVFLEESLKFIPNSNFLIG